MAIDIIIEKLAPRILAEIHKLVGSTIKSKVRGYIERTSNDLFIKRYKNNLDEKLLARYGNETLYDELCDILTKNNNIERVLERCQNIDLDEQLSDEEFVDEIMKGFKISIYNRENIKKILIYISKKAFETFNELKNPENIKLKNSLIKEIRQNRYEIIKVEDNVEKMIKANGVLAEEVHEINDKIDQVLLSQEEGSKIINTGILSKDDIELLQAGNYSIKLIAGTEEDYFCISTEIKIKLSKFNFDSFEEFISYLRFTGKQAEFEVYRMQIKDHNGKVINEYKDESYTDFSISLPLVYVKEMELKKLNFQSMKVLIKPQFDYIKLQLENSEGDVIVPNKKYKIERENKDDSVVAHMLDKFSDGQLITNLEVELFNADPLKVVIRIQINQRIPDRVSGTLELYNLLDKIYNSEEIIGRDIEEDRIVMKGKGFLSNDEETIESLKARSIFYKKLRVLENAFNIRFNIPEIIEEEEVVNVFQICDLLEKGVIRTSGGKLTIKPNQIQMEQGTFEDLAQHKSIVFLCHYQKIEVLNIEIPMANYLRVVHFSDDVSLDSDGNIVMNCTQAFVYNEKKAALTESEIINNLANGKLIITK